MPRPLRILYPGAWYHVMNRGLRFKNIFDTKNHRQIFIDLLAETSDQFNLDIHCFCLMDNHYHLLVNTPLGNLSRAMRHINGVYTQRYNRDKKTDGPLFRGRYKAILIDEEPYLLQVSRYIHLNPLMAKIITNLETYNWSSYRYYIAQHPAPNWLNTKKILEMVSQSNQAMQYKKFVMSDLEDEVLSFYTNENPKVYLGDENNKRKIVKTLDPKKIQASITDYRRLQTTLNINNIIESCIDFFKCDSDELQSIQRGRTKISRHLAMYACRKWTQASLEEIGNLFGGLSITGTSNAINRTKQKLADDEDLRNLFAAMTKEIFKS